MARTTRRSRQQLIVDTLEDAFADLMTADPRAFRGKYRKMAADPFAFYRGAACLFYADMTATKDSWADERTSAVWIHGDLHAENFGTYMNSDGRLVFDVNDFDEAYIGHFSWDLRRFVASLGLLGWQKALPEDAVRKLVAAYLRAYLAQVNHYVESADDDDFALHLGNTEGPVRDLLVAGAAVQPGGASRRDDPARRGGSGLRRGRRRASAGQGGASQGRGSLRHLPGDDPGGQARGPRPLLRRARRRRQVRLRHRQRRAPGVQRARGGLQPVARQRRGACP